MGAGFAFLSLEPIPKILRGKRIAHIIQRKRESQCMGAKWGARNASGQLARIENAKRWQNVHVVAAALACDIDFAGASSAEEKSQNNARTCAEGLGWDLPAGPKGW